MKRRLVVAAVAGLAAAVLPVAAWSAPQAPDATISNIHSSNGAVTSVLTVSGLPVGSTVDPSSVSVTLDGKKLDSTAKPLSNATAAPRRVAILTMDTSGSMSEGGKLAQAQKAADEFLATVPNDVQVGLVTFASQVVTLVAPTTNYDTVRQAVAGLTATGGTALYDAVTESVRQAGSDGVREVLLLTDGKDTNSSITQVEAVNDVQDKGVTINSVSLGKDPTQVLPLRKLADATDGTVITTTDSGELTRFFQENATAISNQLGVEATLPAGWSATEGDLAVTATASSASGDSTVTATAHVLLEPATAVPTSAGPQPVASAGRVGEIATSLLPIALLLLFLALAVIVWVAISVVGRSREEEGSIRGRLSVYTLSGRSPVVVKNDQGTALGDTQVARSAVDLADRVVAQRDLESFVAGKLESAGVPLKASEWLIIHVGIAIGAGLLFLLLFSGKLLPTLLGLALGLIVPWSYLSFRESRREKAFAEQLPDTLQLMAGSLAAGYSMPQAVDTVVREGTTPISSEFNRALIETRLGVPIEDALEGVSLRMKSEDFGWVVMAIRIQREVGGNLAEVLTTVAATLRERERLRRQVQVLSAEGRLSAWILGLLPILFGLYLLLVRPDYLKPMLTEPMGWVMLGVGAVLLVVGAIWLRKVVKVEV